MTSIDTTNNTGGDKTLAAIEFHQRQIAAFETAVENATMKIARATERAEAGLARCQERLDNERAMLAELEG